MSVCDFDCFNCKFDDCINDGDIGMDKIGAPPSERRLKERAYSKARIDRLRAEGLCISCGRAPAAPGHVRCAGCAERASLNTRKRRERLKAAGICPACGRAEAAPGHTMCAACLEKSRASGKKHRQKKREAKG